MSELTRETSAERAGTSTHLPQTLQRRFDEKGEALSARGYRASNFELKLPDRSTHRIGDGGDPAFTVRVVTGEGLKAMESLDELAVAEAFMSGDIDIEGDMLAALKCRPLLGDRHALKYLYATYLAPWIFGQEKSDKKWIKSHYDEDPEFFVLWLDQEIRAYSHGFFEADDESLEAGMLRKFQYAFDACGIEAGHRVLDIGGGWGSFQQFAGDRGVEVTSVTISDESENYINNLIREKGYPGKVYKEHFLEFDGEEPFDAIVNLGVTEHLPDYRRTLAQYQRLLKPGRRVYLDAYSGPRHSMPSFITKWVFQGNTSPLNLEKYLSEVARTSFEVVAIRNDRHNYFLSCKKWAENLEAHRDEVISRWGKFLFRRFQIYLWSAANSFHTGTLCAHRMILQLPSTDSGPLAAVESWRQ